MAIAEKFVGVMNELNTKAEQIQGDKIAMEDLINGLTRAMVDAGLRGNQVLKELTSTAPEARRGDYQSQLDAAQAIADAMRGSIVRLNRVASFFKDADTLAVTASTAYKVGEEYHDYLGTVSNGAQQSQALSMETVAIWKQEIKAKDATIAKLTQSLETADGTIKKFLTSQRKTLDTLGVAMDKVLQPDAGPTLSLDATNLDGSHPVTDVTDLTDLTDLTMPSSVDVDTDVEVSETKYGSAEEEDHPRDRKPKSSKRCSGS
jgi:hypothetical protein